jgi:hypothetical protein
MICLLIRGYRKESALRGLRKVLPLLTIMAKHIEQYQQSLVDQSVDFDQFVLFIQFMHSHTKSFWQQCDFNDRHLPQETRKNFEKIKSIFICFDSMDELRGLGKGEIPTAATIVLGKNYVWPDVWVKNVEYVKKGNMPPKFLETYQSHARLIISFYIPLVEFIKELEKRVKSHA